MASILVELYKRQATFDDNGNVVNGDDNRDDDGDWYYSDKSEIVKYVVVGVILLIFVLWIVLGAWHANRRVRNGQRPLLYHRWLVSSRYRYQTNPYYYPHDPSTGLPPYQMQVFPYPPQNQPYGPPPQYQAPEHPPPGASKVNPDQTIGVVEVPREDGASSSNAASNLQQPAPTQAASPSRR